MKKLRLELDALAVESFAAGTDPAGRLGTVRGRDRAPADPYDKPTLDHTDCPIYSCTCSNGEPFTECDCEPAAPDPAAAG